MLVFSGRSGAGKTTTARAFERAGARLVSEDLLDGLGGVNLDRRAARLAIGGEARDPPGSSSKRRISHARRPTRSVQAARSLWGGPPRSVAQILLVDATRRAGQSIQRDELAHPDALVALIESAYIASPDARAWRARFVLLRDLVCRVATSRVTMPEGLPALEAAARALQLPNQSATIAS